jgi:hypothetical protein
VPPIPAPRPGHLNSINQPRQGQDRDVAGPDAFLTPFLELGSLAAQVAISAVAQSCRYLRAYGPFEPGRLRHEPGSSAD